MSGSQMSGQGGALAPTERGLAFDYVTGQLRGAERQALARRLEQDKALQLEVHYWEEQLMSLSDQTQEVAPDPALWGAIAARLLPESARPAKSARLSWLWPSLSAAASLVLAFGFWLVFTPAPLQQPNADYVAVLTDTQGAAQLTVLTAAGGAQLWLKWDEVALAEDKNLQLWAVSKRDGQIRPLGVFAHTDIRRLPLDVARLRLIKDAAQLLLTEEDIGGSPLDEPSDIVIAKGACVLLAEVKKTI